jgi:hypothetical protein
MATIPVDINDLPHHLEYTLTAGDTLVLLLQLKINSTAVNLTNCTLRLAGTGPNGGTLTARDITPSTAASGMFDGGLTATETGAWTAGDAKYEVECTFPVGDTNFAAGAVKTLIRVTVHITADTA